MKLFFLSFFLLIGCSEHASLERKKLRKEVAIDSTYYPPKREIKSWRDVIINCKSDLTSNTFRLNNLEITSTIIPIPLSWKNAENAAKIFGENWRLPTKEELIIMHQNSEIIALEKGQFVPYWSSEKKKPPKYMSDLSFKGKHIAVTDFNNGNGVLYIDRARLNVRLVRTIK
jgi:hypothetical protein